MSTQFDFHSIVTIYVVNKPDLSDKVGCHVVDEAKIAKDVGRHVVNGLFNVSLTCVYTQGLCGFRVPS